MNEDRVHASAAQADTPGRPPVQRIVLECVGPGLGWLGVIDNERGSVTASGASASAALTAVTMRYLELHLDELESAGLAEYEAQRAG
jgi:hypothetical protein